MYSQAPSLVRASCKARLDQLDWVWGIVQLEVKEGPLRGRWDLELVGLGWVAVGAGVWGVGWVSAVVSPQQLAVKPAGGKG